MATVGLSKPYYAIYSNSGTTVTYANGGLLGRASEVDLSLENADANILYLDNAPAESVQSFAGGTLTLNIGELSLSVAAAIFGLTTESVTTPSGTVLAFPAEPSIPYVGIGFIIKGITNGTANWMAVLLTKAQFQIPGDAATTQGESIEWQTKELTATLMRDDTANGDWKKLGYFASEADAETWLKSQLSIT